MEPFFVANCVGVDTYRYGHFNIEFFRILYTDVAFTYTSSDQGYSDWILIFTNVENNCYVSFYIIGYQEQFIVPANSYYIIFDISDHGPSFDKNGIFYLVRESGGGAEELPNVRTFFRMTKESILLKNININQWVAP